MSGHSKWANIKHKKGRMDAIRGKLTTKIGREITVAVKAGGADPAGNMRLKLALQKAKENNVPKDNIQRAIQKGQGTLDGGNFDEMMYEGYGPGGVAVLIEIMTDNRNRPPPIYAIFLPKMAEISANRVVWPGCLIKKDYSWWKSRLKLTKKN